jgi:hypothetical protein
MKRNSTMIRRNTNISAIKNQAFDTMLMCHAAYLAGQADKSAKVIATGSLSAHYTDFEVLILLRCTVVRSL